MLTPEERRLFMLLLRPTSLALLTSAMLSENHTCSIISTELLNNSYIPKLPVRSLLLLLLLLQVRTLLSQGSSVLHAVLRAMMQRASQWNLLIWCRYHIITAKSWDGPYVHKGCSLDVAYLGQWRHVTQYSSPWHSAKSASWVCQGLQCRRLSRRLCVVYY